MKSPRFTPADIAALEAGLNRRYAEIDTQWLLVQRLMASAFDVARDPRSPEYRAGVQDMLAFKLCGKPLHNPYVSATAASDAWFAGKDEGFAILKQRSHCAQATA